MICEIIILSDCNIKRSENLLMTLRSTPTKGRTKSVPVCDDVPGEFCKRVLSLMASFYETPSTTEQLTFPPAKKANPPQSQAQKLEFESSITDLRVRREQESQASSIASINDSINKRVEEIASEFNQSNVDLDDVFAPEVVVRPEIPKYLLNQQLDEKFEIERRKKRRLLPMDVQEIEKKQTARLQTAKEKGIERAKKRIEKQQGQTPTPTKRYYQSKTFKNDEKSIRSVSKQKQNDINERRQKMLNYTNSEEYREITKSPRTPHGRRTSNNINNSDDLD